MKLIASNFAFRRSTSTITPFDADLLLALGQSESLSARLDETGNLLLLCFANDAISFFVEKAGAYFFLMKDTHISRGLSMSANLGTDRRTASHICPSWHYTCCGNEICLACYKENKVSINKQNEKNTGKKVALTCPFCREPAPTSMEYERRLQARCLQNDLNALPMMGERYREGKYGTPKDDLKSLDYYIRAVELGSGEACANIGKGYREGNGVAVDKKKAALFNRVGALRGDIVSRHNIGSSEYHDLGNHEIAIRRWKIAAEAGFQKSLNALRDIYNSNGKFSGNEFITKEYLDFAYRACHETQMEVKREKHRNEG